MSANVGFTEVNFRRNFCAGTRKSVLSIECPLYRVSALQRCPLWRGCDVRVSLRVRSE